MIDRLTAAGFQRTAIKTAPQFSLWERGGRLYSEEAAMKLACPDCEKERAIVAQVLCFVAEAGCAVDLRNGIPVLCGPRPGGNLLELLAEFRESILAHLKGEPVVCLKHWGSSRGERPQSVDEVPGDADATPRPPGDTVSLVGIAHGLAGGVGPGEPAGDHPDESGNGGSDRASCGMAPRGG